MRGTTRRSLSGASLMAIFGLGALLLPIVPMWAQADPPEPPRPDPERKVIRFVEDVFLQDVAPAQRAEEIEKHRREAKKLAEEMQKITEQFQAMEKRFQDLQKRLADLGDPEAKDRVIRMRLHAVGPVPAMPPAGLPGQVRVFVAQDELAIHAAQLKAKEAAVQEAEARLEQARLEQERKQRLHESKAISKEDYEKAVVEVRVMQAQLKARQAELEEVKARIEAAKKQGLDVRGNRIFTAPVPPPPVAVAPVVGDGDRRLSELEKKLAELLREVQAIRQEKGRPAPGRGAQPELRREAPAPDGALPGGLPSTERRPTAPLPGSSPSRDERRP